MFFTGNKQLLGMYINSNNKGFQTTDFLILFPIYCIVHDCISLCAGSDINYNLTSLIKSEHSECVA